MTPLQLSAALEEMAHVYVAQYERQLRHPLKRVDLQQIQLGYLAGRKSLLLEAAARIRKTADLVPDNRPPVDYSKHAGPYEHGDFE